MSNFLHDVVDNEGAKDIAIPRVFSENGRANKTIPGAIQLAMIS